MCLVGQGLSVFDCPLSILVCPLSVQTTVHQLPPIADYEMRHSEIILDYWGLEEWERGGMPAIWTPFSDTFVLLIVTKINSHRMMHRTLQQEFK